MVSRPQADCQTSSDCDDTEGPQTIRGICTSLFLVILSGVVEGVHAIETLQLFFLFSEAQRLVIR